MGIAVNWTKQTVNPTLYTKQTVNPTLWSPVSLVATGALLLSSGNLLALSTGDTLGIYVL